MGQEIDVIFGKSMIVPLKYLEGALNPVSGIWEYATWTKALNGKRTVTFLNDDKEYDPDVDDIKVIDRSGFPPKGERMMYPDGALRIIE